MALFPIVVTQDFLNDKLDSRKGAIYENLASSMINKASLPLYYFSNGKDHLEIDFILESNEGIILVEEKTVNRKMAASRALMEGRTPYKASKCYKVIKENIGKGSFYTSIPHYVLPFILENIKNEINKGVSFSALEYPSDIK